jgi:hypothetical protein
MNDLIFIHIGKCGGTTIAEELHQNNILHEEIHMEEIKYDSSKKYLISIRNPIQRFISAFYWRYYLVCCDKNINQTNRFPNEKNILNKYVTVDKLAQDLKNNQNIFNGDMKSHNYIHHLAEDIDFHLKNFINECPKDKIKGVICTETICKDMRTIFNVTVIKNKKNNKSFDKQITSETRDILKLYLKKDYEIIDKMYAQKWITIDQYNILKI